MILNIATIFDDQVFVVHAGLSRFDDLAIDYINELDHTSCTMPSVFTEDVEADDLVYELFYKL